MCSTNVGFVGKSVMGSLFSCNEMGILYNKYPILLFLRGRREEI